MEGQGPVQDIFVPLLAGVGDSYIEAIILYGSHLLGANPGKHSAYDLVIIVGEYRGFYEALYSAHMIHRFPLVMTIVNRFLPPNVIRLAPEGTDGPIAKCLVLDRCDFERSLRIGRARDHFMISRMMQKVQVVYSRSASIEEWVESNLKVARYGVLSWATLWIEQPFDSGSLAREMLRICYRSENRPESSDRADAIFSVQERELMEYYGDVLNEAEIKGDVVKEIAGYRIQNPISKKSRMRGLIYFKLSKVRVTLSWLKHVVTFEGWLPYIVRKVERRTSSQINLTMIEKLLPIPFLLPRVLYVFWNRPEQETERTRSIRTAEGQREG